MLKDILTFWAVCLLLLVSAASGCAAGSTLKVAFYELDGFFERGADGARGGYGVEPLEKISEYSGIHFEYVQADTWEQTKTLLLSGKADVRLPVTLPSSRQSHLEYTEGSVMNTYRALMTLKSRGDLYYKDYAHFSTLKVAISKSFYIATACADIWTISASPTKTSSSSTSTWIAGARWTREKWMR